MFGRMAEKILWTEHAQMKMRHYRLTESRIKRIIRYPTRVEEGILEGAVAAMQPSGSAKYSEIWAMYVLLKTKDKGKKIKVITAWRYPGRAPERNPIPSNILKEIRNIL